MQFLVEDSLKAPAGIRMIKNRLDSVWFLVLPILILVGFLYIIPLLNVLLISFSDPSPGVGNFHRLFTARGPLKVLITTLRVCLITSAITVVLAYVVAYALAMASSMHRQLLMIGVLVPLWISVLIRAMSWLVLLRDNGPVNNWLIEHGWIDEPLQMVRNELGVVVGMVHYLLPYAVLPLFATMRDIDEKLLFASRSLGARSTQTFFRVYLPLTVPGVFAATVVVFVFGLGFYVTPAILGGGRVVMMAESINVEVMQTLRWGFGAAQAVFLLVVTMILIRVMAKTVGLKRGFG